jgi:hypothetical protein
MNFLPSRLEQNGDGLKLRLSDTLAFPVPQNRVARYRAPVGKELTFGLRPEHITEPRGEGRNPNCEFTATLDVVEPMGMETMVYFTVNGHEICARVEPSAATGPGQPMRLYANSTCIRRSNHRSALGNRVKIAYFHPSCLQGSRAPSPFLVLFERNLSLGEMGRCAAGRSICGTHW